MIRLGADVRGSGADECVVGRVLTPTNKGKKRKTATYVGSAQETLLDPNQKIPFGVSKRVSDYDKVDQAWTKVINGTAKQEDKDRFFKLRAGCYRHGMAWPVSLADSDGLNDFDGWTLESSAWWVVYSETREEHFTSLCGGVSEAGEQLQKLWYQNPGGKLTHLEDVSTNWFHLVETFYILFNGAAPTSANGREWASPFVWQLRTVGLKPLDSLLFTPPGSFPYWVGLKNANTNGIWLEPPTGSNVQFVECNRRLALYEKVSFDVYPREFVGGFEG